jgi:hypothetical protein
MLSLDRCMSFEVEFHRVAIAVAQMLAREMDDHFLWLLEQANLDTDSPEHHTAEAANRVVVLCRRLVEEIQRYQRCEQIRREIQQEQGLDEDDRPF